MSQSKKQHKLAISLLKELGLTHVRLEKLKDGFYHYVAWNTPTPANNAHPPTVKRGKVSG